VLVSCTHRRFLPTARETSAKRFPDGKNGESKARNEESCNGGWESDVFEAGLPFGGLTFCFFAMAGDEWVVVIRGIG